jgi:hypothetical protein
VGVGEHLWVALSGTSAPLPIASPNLVPAPETPTVVINEVLASTIDFIPTGATRPVDCVEIFNGSDKPVNLGGWKLRRVAGAEETQGADFDFPPYLLQPRELKVIYCTAGTGTWSAPFKLPETGCTLHLINAQGGESDIFSYADQQPDISYARLFDGSRTLVYNPFPSIGTTNYDNGNAEPKLVFKGLDYTLLKTGLWRFRARAWDDNGMFTMMIFWREVTTSSTPRSGTIPLFDDGMHDDGASLDGVFAGDWSSPLPRGTAIEFYLTGEDLTGQSETEPEKPEFTVTGQPIKNYTIALPATTSGWEISEVVPVNKTGLRDEAGKKPDWAELRYTGTSSAPVQNLFLSDSLFGYETDKLYDVSRLGATVAPNTWQIVFLKGTEADPTKVRHAPFKVAADGTGDSIYLLRRLASGATEFVDAVKVPPLLPDVAYARAGVGGPFVETTPTPNAQNSRRGGSVHMVPGANGRKDCLFVFPGGGRVDASFDLRTWTTVMSAVPNNGIERVYREPINSPARFFRVR